MKLNSAPRIYICYYFRGWTKASKLHNPQDTELQVLFKLRVVCTFTVFWCIKAVNVEYTEIPQWKCSPLSHGDIYSTPCLPILQKSPILVGLQLVYKRQVWCFSRKNPRSRPLWLTLYHKVVFKPWLSSCPARWAGIALHQPMVACHVLDCAVGHTRLR